MRVGAVGAVCARQAQEVELEEDTYQGGIREDVLINYLVAIYKRGGICKVYGCEWKSAAAASSHHQPRHK